jgi:hypothetical protein
MVLDEHLSRRPVGRQRWERKSLGEFEAHSWFDGACVCVVAAVVRDYDVDQLRWDVRALPC